MGGAVLKRSGAVVLAAALLALVSGCGEDLPTDPAMRDALQQTLPAHLSITSFALAEDPEPLRAAGRDFSIRFQAAIETSEDLFETAELAVDPADGVSVTALRQVAEAGDQIGLTGTVVVGRAGADTWAPPEFSADNPLFGDLAAPFDTFEGRTVVLGTRAAAELRERIQEDRRAREVAEAEAAAQAEAAAEREREERRRMTTEERERQRRAEAEERRAQAATLLEERNGLLYAFTNSGVIDPDLEFRGACEGADGFEFAMVFTSANRRSGAVSMDFKFPRESTGACSGKGVIDEGELEIGNLLETCGEPWSDLRFRFAPASEDAIAGTGWSLRGQIHCDARVERRRIEDR